MSQWIILDRDGVINDTSGGLLDDLAKWRPFPGAIEAIAALSKAGFKVAVATNQSVVGKGLVSQEAIEAIHENLHHSVKLYGGELQGIYYCPHKKDEGCDCRKPDIGLVRQIEQASGEKVAGGLCVGDSLTDLDFARAADCTPVLVRTGKGTQTEVAILLYPERAEAVKIYDSLAQLAEELIAAQSAYA